MGTSGTMDRFAAELEGALHVKEQEKIIAEVRQHCHRMDSLLMVCIRVQGCPVCTPAGVSKTADSALS